MSSTSREPTQTNKTKRGVYMSVIKRIKLSQLALNASVGGTPRAKGQSKFDDTEIIVDFTPVETNIVAIASALTDRGTIRAEFASADTALHTTISTEIDGDVLVETNRATGIENGLRTDVDTNASDITAETNRAELIEGGLRTDVNTAQGDIDAILLASDADKNSFAEIVTLISSVDTANDTAFGGHVTAYNTKMGLLDGIDAGLRTDVDAVTAELAVSQTGAGLEADGLYVADPRNYMLGAVSLKDADAKLDTAIKAVDDARIASVNAVRSMNFYASVEVMAVNDLGALEEEILVFADSVASIPLYFGSKEKLRAGTNKLVSDWLVSGAEDFSKMMVSLNGVQLIPGNDTEFNANKCDYRFITGIAGDKLELQFSAGLLEEGDFLSLWGSFVTVP